MGGEAYWYVVPHEDVQSALDKLRAREFKAGRYNPAMATIHFPITDRSPSPGPKHKSIDEALGASGADGTRSILDIMAISKKPEMSCASPLDAQLLFDLYAAAHPTRAQVEANMDFLEDVDRGQAVYIILYEAGAPSEIMFAGYSFD